MFELLLHIGTLVFAISGALTKYLQKIRFIWCVLYRFVTAFRGGTVRDVMIGRTPVGGC